MTFELRILDATFDTLTLGYEPKLAWEKLQHAWSTQTALVVSVDDIASYDWERQTLTLALSCTNAIVDRFWSPVRPKDPEGFLGMRAFVVTLDREAIYGGIFLRRISAMGIDYPVVYPRWSGDQLELSIRPVHMIGRETTEFEPTWSGVKDPRIRAAMAGRLV